MNELLTIVGLPVLRSVAGWLENALQDNKISAFEWKELVKTVLKLGVPALALFYGFALPAEFAASIPVVVDYGFSYYQQALKKAI
jgi:hypothetical protein